jgi:hypothetical protein
LLLILLPASLRFLSASDLKWLNGVRRVKDGHSLNLLEYALFPFLFLAIFVMMPMQLWCFFVYEWFDGYFSLLFGGFVKEVMDLIEFSG